MDENALKGIKISSMVSGKNKPVANQFIIKTRSWTFFQSFDHIIARRCNTNGAVVLDEKYWCGCAITSKYRNLFLKCSRLEIDRKLQKGFYTLANLNVPLKTGK